MALSEQKFEELKTRLELSKNTQASTTAKPKGMLSGLKDVAIGAAKGLVEGPIATAKFAQRTGQRFLGAISPSKTYEDLKAESDKSKLIDYPMVEDTLKAKNPEQKAGKALEFFAELLWPVGATTEGAALIDKGRKVVGANFDNFGSRLNGLTDNLVEEGGKIKEGVIDYLTKIDDRTKAALSRTTKDEFKKFLEQGQKSLLDDQNPSLLDTVGESLVQGLKSVKNKADEIGAQKSKYLNDARIGLKQIPNVADEMLTEITKSFSKLKLDQADDKLVDYFYRTFEKLGNNPTVREVDKVVDLLQDKLYKSSVPGAVEVTNRIVGPLRSILGKLNSKVKDVAGSEYIKYNDEYSKIIGLVNELNSRLGKKGASAGAFIKRLFSPSDGRTKKLFAELQKYTGADYFRDARVAKFIMEALGDKRAESLLEQVPQSIGGVFNKILKYGAKKLGDPLKGAEKYLK